MKLKNILLTLGLTISLGLYVSSCKDDFLQEDLTTTYSTQQFKTQEGLDQLVTGTYQKLKFKFNYTWGIKMFNVGVDELQTPTTPSLIITATVLI
ncbi:hypothetical protein [Saccharicrinis fermentans]|uniref:RagB/SusD family nutrient uptake outer membrane protein n=1 Tax=Saccharicrinis fermentans DSM 9555 = JCM 21142 TaxID=869213 RepID=W7Y3H7_9BACT|nr:hypothetical protein [Saccharicrinis fermentans]GAF02113.1 hypothetical protein JCM21142_2740 [Saccharicrinis fermentans DSM 9555 = JCM 21142]